MLSMMEKNALNRLLRLSQVKNNIWFKDFDWVVINNIGRSHKHEYRTWI